jgi:hypothetical protein
VILSLLLSEFPSCLQGYVLIYSFRRGFPPAGPMGPMGGMGMGMPGMGMGMGMPGMGMGMPVSQYWFSNLNLADHQGMGFMPGMRPGFGGPMGPVSLPAPSLT